MRRMLVLLCTLAIGVLALSPAPAHAALPKPTKCEGCWQPALETSWQWQLSGKVDTSVDVAMYDIDGFDSSRKLIRRLHRDGRAAVCYMSAGSWEKWRSDASDFPDSVIGRKLSGWPGERWLDIRSIDLLGPIMQKRLDMCARKGFDAVEFDNVDAFEARTGFPLTARDQLRYNSWLANQAHSRGLAVALKNDLGQVKRLLPYFDFALNEECFDYRECRRLKPFVAAGKAVFGVEYDMDTTEFCPKANALNLNFLKKRLALRVWRVACR